MEVVAACSSREAVGTGAGKPPWEGTRALIAGRGFYVF